MKELRGIKSSFTPLFITGLIFTFTVILIFSCAGTKEGKKQTFDDDKIRALHLLNHTTDDDLDLLCEFKACA